MKKQSIVMLITASLILASCQKTVPAKPSYNIQASATGSNKHLYINGSEKPLNNFVAIYSGDYVDLKSWTDSAGVYGYVVCKITISGVSQFQSGNAIEEIILTER
jgi:hypothetical protein